MADLSLKPYAKPPKVPPVGLVRDDGRIVLEDGTTHGLLSMDPDDRTQVYADRDTARTHAIGHKRGTIIRWNDSWVRWEVGGRSVILLGGFPGDSEHVLAGLVAWRDWVRSIGATIGTVGSTSLSILRASLDRRIVVAGGDPPPIPEVIGGRQESGVVEGYYGPFVAWDLAAAYTRVLGGVCYPPGGWTHGGAELPPEAEPWPTFARAEVTVPGELRWAPIPRRMRRPPPSIASRKLTPREYPVGKRVRGIWSSVELRAAERAGASVRVRDVWRITARRPTYPFRPWLDLIEVGRRLPGYAGTLVKMCGNALWGRFIYYGERTRVSWESGDRIEDPDPFPNRGIPALDLAELVTSTVRARVLDDLLVPYGEQVWSVHTDGGLVDASATVALPSDWRAKDRGRSLIYLSPQMYAWSDGRGLRYKVAGVGPRDAEAAFTAARESVLGPAPIPLDPRTELGKDPRR